MVFTLLQQRISGSASKTASSAQTRTQSMRPFIQLSLWSGLVLVLFVANIKTDTEKRYLLRLEARAPLLVAPTERLIVSMSAMSINVRTKCLSTSGPSSPGQGRRTISLCRAANSWCFRGGQNVLTCCCTIFGGGQNMILKISRGTIARLPAPWLRAWICALGKSHCFPHSPPKIKLSRLRFHANYRFVAESKSVSSYIFGVDFSV